jgi:hypothetical protein
MKNSTIKVTLIIIAILSFVYLFFLNKGEDDIKKISLIKERKIKLLNQRKINLMFNYTPQYMDLKKESLFVLNYETQKVQSLSKNRGEIIDSLGLGRGDSPLENNRMYHYDVGEKYFYSFDVSNYSISKSTIKKPTLIKYYKDSLRINHAQRTIGDDFIISFRDYKTNITFGKLNIGTGKIEMLDKVNNQFKKIDDSWWVYDGVFDRNEVTKEIFYVTFYSDELLKLNYEGDLVYKVKLIHQTPLIKLANQGDMLIPSENAYESVLDTAIDSDYIYVLSNISDSVQKENKGKRVIDVYFSKDGSYSHSYILPNLEDDNLPQEIEVSKNSVYVIYENSIEIFDFI